MAYRINNVGIDCNDLRGMTEFWQAVTGLGARELAHHGKEADQWAVLADPEGNQFCLVPA